MADETDETKTKADDEGNKTKPAITFPTEGAFHAAVDKKLKPAIAKAVAEANRALLEQLGLDSEDELPNVVETVKKSKTAATESETLKRDLTKLSKQAKELQDSNAGLLNWKHTAIKQNALAPFSGKTVDLETLSALVLPRISIGDDDSVSGPDGKSIEDLVESVFKAKPFLKVPDNNAGAGTKPGGGKSDGKGTKAADKAADETKANGTNTKLSIGQTVVAALMAQKNENGTGP